MPSSSDKQNSNKLTLSGYGFTIEINEAGESLIWNTEGKVVTDIHQRLAAQEALIVPLIATLDKSWKNDLAELQAMSVKINSMSSTLTDAFTLADTIHRVSATIGKTMYDGTVYAGISPTTKTKMYVTPADLGLKSWNEGILPARWLKNLCGFECSKQIHAEDLADAKKDDGGWRLPTQDELIALYKNKNDIGGFHSEEPWYWSSSTLKENVAQMYNLWHGKYSSDNKHQRHSIRLVRSEPR